MHHGGPPRSNPVKGESSMPVDHRITGGRARGLMASELVADDAAHVLGLRRAVVRYHARGASR
jgi:hypothetical protein